MARYYVSEKLFGTRKFRKPLCYYGNAFLHYMILLLIIVAFLIFCSTPSFAGRVRSDPSVLSRPLLGNEYGHYFGSARGSRIHTLIYLLTRTFENLPAVCCCSVDSNDNGMFPTQFSPSGFL